MHITTNLLFSVLEGSSDDPRHQGKTMHQQSCPSVWQHNAQDPERNLFVDASRQSKLTAALRDAIGGNSNTVMIANLWPEEAHLEESVSTLRFASRVRCLQTDAQVNESSDPLLALKKAERQIKELRQELAMRDMLAGRGRVLYDDPSDGERLELQQLVLRYLSGVQPAVAGFVYPCCSA